MNSLLREITNEDLMQLQLLVSMHIEVLTLTNDTLERLENSNLSKVEYFALSRGRNENIFTKFNLLNSNNYSIQDIRYKYEVLSLTNPMLKYDPFKHNIKIKIKMPIDQIEYHIQMIVSRILTNFHNALLEHIRDIEEIYNQRIKEGITDIERDYYRKFQEYVAIIHYLYDFPPIRATDIVKYKSFDKLREDYKYSTPSIPDAVDFNYKMLIDMLSYPVKVSEYYQNQGIYVPLTNYAYPEEDIYNMCNMNSTEEVEIFDILINYCREMGILPTVRKVFNEKQNEINEEVIFITKQLIFDDSDIISRHLPLGDIENVNRNIDIIDSQGLIQVIRDPNTIRYFIID